MTKIDIKKFWAFIMNNERLFDLTSPPSAEFDTAQELLWYCNNHVKQNDYALSTKNSIREKYHNQIDFGGKYQEVRKHPIANNKDKHHPGSTIDHNSINISLSSYRVTSLNLHLSLYLLSRSVSFFRFISLSPYLIIALILILLISEISL